MALEHFDRMAENLNGALETAADKMIKEGYHFVEPIADRIQKQFRV